MPDWTTATVDTTRGVVSYAEHGEGSPLVLLHSLLTDRHAFDEVTDRLPGRKITIDLPGFGSTTPAEPTIEGYAKMINAAIGAICEDAGPVTVMGNGLGAFVTLGMALEDNPAFDRMVLVGCGVTFPEDARPAFSGMIRAVETGGMAAVTQTALRRIFTESYLSDHPDAAAGRSRVLAKTDEQAFTTACRALERVDFSDRARLIEIPTLMVVGEDDQATPPGMARQLHEAVSNSRLVILPGVAHAPQIQDPARFISAVEGFLEGI